MKKIYFALIVSAIAIALIAKPVPKEDTIGKKVRAYFDEIFAGLKAAAEKQPTAETFRETMRPVVAKVGGLFGGSYIDTDWIIREVLFRSHFLARGYDLKEVKELDYFREQMKKKPAPQLSEPVAGGIIQPGLITMRYPVMKDGHLIGIISIMVRTDSFLKAVGLDKVKAFKIICREIEAESRGTLSASPKTVTLSLPSTTWTIKYDMQ
jgi:hypothetical protein